MCCSFSRWALARGALTSSVCVVIASVAHPRYLIETSETYPDGRARMGTNQLPGNKKHPYENARQAAERLSKELLNMPDCGIEFGVEIDHIEQSVESPSYPGVHTVYKKEILTGRVTTKDDARLCVCVCGYSAEIIR